MQIFANNAVSTIGAPMSAVATSMQLAAGTGSLFPSPAGGDYFLLTLGRVVAGVETAIEIVKVTNRASDILTLVRGQEGTTAVTHTTGDFASLRMTADSMANINVNSISAKTGMTAPAFNGNATTATTAAALSGINPVANGGTGSSTAAAALANLGGYPAANPANFIAASGAPVQSVGGFAGAVTKAQLGIDQVNNTLDMNKPVSTLQQAAINAKTLGGIATSTADMLTGAAIASSATLNLDTATGNRVHVTGTTAILAVTLTRGPRTVIFDGVLALTHHATNNNLPGGANITTAPGDRAQYESDGSKVYCVAYTKADGTPLVVASTGAVVLLATATVGAAVAMIDFLNVFSAAYDKYTIEGQGIRVSGYDVVALRLANGGVVDAGANYFQGVLSGQSSSTGSSVSLSSNLNLDGKGLNFSLELANANDAANLKSLWARAIFQPGSANLWEGLMYQYGYFAASAVSGFRLFLSRGSNFTAGTIRIVGHKNA